MHLYTALQYSGARKGEDQTLWPKAEKGDVMHGSRKIYPMAVLLLVGLLIGTAPAAPQEDDDYTFFDIVEVEVINVEVIVTGPDGVPVQGLTREDFELFEDGRPVEISNFYSVADEPIEALDPLASVVELEHVKPPDQDLHLGIFVDGMTLEPQNRRRVLDAVRDFFNYQNVRPNSLVLASFDGKLEVESVPRYDPDFVNQYMEQLSQSSTLGSLNEMERRQLLAELGRAAIGSGASLSGLATPDVGATEAQRLLLAVDIHAQQQFDRAKRSAEALKSVVEALAGLPGRKALLYVSGGLARNPGEAMYYAWENKFADYARGIGINIPLHARELDTTPLIRDAIRHANANRVTFYTAGAGRGGNSGVMSAEQGGNVDPGSISTPGGGLSWSVGLEAIDNSNLTGPLEEMAAATGGLSMTHSKNFAELMNGMQRDFGGYYSLGFTPSGERKKKAHKVQVRVKSRDLQVRHRENYRNQTRDELMNGRTRSALLVGAQGNPLQVKMEFGRVARDEKGHYMVPVIVKVPLSNLVLVPQDEVHVGRIGIFICARDSKGRTSPVQSVDVPIRIPNDKLLAALGQVAGYRMTLKMRADEHNVAVGVRDELGRVESTVSDSYAPTTPIT